MLNKQIRGVVKKREGNSLKLDEMQFLNHQTEAATPQLKYHHHAS